MPAVSRGKVDPISFCRRPRASFAQIEIDYAMETHDTIVSDESWKGASSPIRRSEIYAGELYDARLEQADWNKPNFDDARWSSAVAIDPPSTLVGEPVVCASSGDADADPKTVTPSGNGTYVVDMGQNMVGWVTLRATGARGTAIRLRFAEILNPTAVFIARTCATRRHGPVHPARRRGRTFTPYFTFHGFRYVEVTGYPGVPTTESIKGEVVSSVSGEPVGRLNTSSEMVNRMWSIASGDSGAIF